MKKQNYLLEITPENLKLFSLKDFVRCLPHYVPRPNKSSKPTLWGALREDYDTFIKELSSTQVTQEEEISGYIDHIVIGKEIEVDPEGVLLQEEEGTTYLTMNRIRFAFLYDAFSLTDVCKVQGKHIKRVSVSFGGQRPKATLYLDVVPTFAAYAAKDYLRVFSRYLDSRRKHAK